MSTSLVNNGNWHYLTGVRDGDMVYLYVDGVKDGTPQSGALNFVTPAASNLARWRIGTSTACGVPTTLSGAYTGLIDDVRIYNAAIPVSQIKENYYAGLNNLLNSGGITREEYQSRVLDLNNRYGKR